MKTLSICAVVLFSVLSSTTTNAQNSLTKETFKVWGNCGMCKKTIEHDLLFEKGVKKVSLDLDTKVVTVVYNSKKTDEEKIRIAITKIGYDADSLKADQKAFNKLPLCCREPGHED